ncbi:transposase [Solwaraspora sp. WMMA2080]|uniref:transposase n=1 Tax=unclassified Solwaraspora TaxID=2627926 RepID=UPI00248C5ECB|nr:MULTISPECIES: transposase [unclassified Solwaraspora]WBB99334.1 transposase [Solwaraspora sp. WMMA2059]WBC22116.1 transposase [Solwaraspora sp. WMMA2080]
MSLDPTGNGRRRWTIPHRPQHYRRLGIRRGDGRGERQYMGCAGRVFNGINTVHLAYVRERTGHALIAARQWIPTEQITDPATAARTGLTPGLEFRTKGQLAIDLCTHAYADELTFDVICGDEVYGNCTEPRGFLESRGQAYVLRVASTFMIQMPSGDRLTSAQAVTELAAGSGRGWHVRSADAGSKGHRWYAWAWIATASPRHHLLVRRHLATGELAMHYCHVPESSRRSCRGWSAPPACGGRSRNASSWARTTSAWTSARPAPSTTHNHPTTPSTGSPGDDATRPAPAGTTNSPASTANTPWSTSNWRAAVVAPDAFAGRHRARGRWSLPAAYRDQQRRRRTCRPRLRPHTGGCGTHR